MYTKYWMAICFPFIKYLYLSCLFITAFMSTYNETTEMIGYSCVFVLQIVFTIAVALDIIEDGNRNAKILYFPNIPNNLGIITETKIPIWWFIIAGSILQFVSSLITVITSSYLYKRFNSLRMSRQNRRYLSSYRTSYIICTVFLMILIFTFLQFGGGTIALSSTYKLLVVVCFIGIIITSSLDVFYSNRLSKLIGSTTDG